MESHKPLIETGAVIANRPLCREHFRLTLAVSRFGPAQPGQFVHLCPAHLGVSTVDPLDFSQPMLRRAFSIAALMRHAGEARIDVIYRVVGTATRWMASLGEGDAVSVLGPLGNAFPIRADKAHAWMVAGGVGLPPMLWLAEALQAAKRHAVAFCGFQRAELIPLTLGLELPPDPAAGEARASAAEFAEHGVPVIVSTDDGSIGFRGYVGSALAAYHQANPIAADDLVVYTCGPEAMMKSVAAYCTGRGIECYACVERNMACGTGMCQSCVVPINDTRDPEGWIYRLCCTDGPVFDASTILWDRHP